MPTEEERQRAERLAENEKRMQEEDAVREAEIAERARKRKEEGK